ncbi:hypothetical protein M2444_004740 [Paenibacillus sp. PastF-3]|uniref:hypothetical protein n=1 Tax=unclassified Paenibacillus TaxID=185978 RepID=UPI001E089E5F|nr:hypothetical protein [Paenibacillus sp. PastF-3]MBY3621125.1 hypothetical protein [Acinetobacter sp. CUI P1]MDH6372911.1 hypothetical protein [Paenibacillus sp. PastF-3]
MYGEQHLLAFKSNEKSTVIYSLTYPQVGWWALGGLITMKLGGIISPIPGIGPFGYIFHLIPFLICLAFAHIKHPRTGLSLHKFIFNYIHCRIRKRKFL